MVEFQQFQGVKFSIFSLFLCMENPCFYFYSACCQLMNSESQLQCGRTSDIFFPFHPLQYKLYSSIIPNTVVMGCRSLAGWLPLITSMGITQPNQHLPQGCVFTVWCGEACHLYPVCYLCYEKCQPTLTHLKSAQCFHGPTKVVLLCGSGGQVRKWFSKLSDNSTSA